MLRTIPSRLSQQLVLYFLSFLTHPPSFSLASLLSRCSRKPHSILQNLWKYSIIPCSDWRFDSLLDHLSFSLYLIQRGRRLILKHMLLWTNEYRSLLIGNEARRRLEVILVAATRTSISFYTRWRRRPRIPTSYERKSSTSSSPHAIPQQSHLVTSYSRSSAIRTYGRNSEPKCSALVHSKSPSSFSNPSKLPEPSLMRRYASIYQHRGSAVQHCETLYYRLVAVRTDAPRCSCPRAKSSRWIFTRYSAVLRSGVMTRTSSSRIAGAKVNLYGKQSGTISPSSEACDCVLPRIRY